MQSKSASRKKKNASKPRAGSLKKMIIGLLNQLITSLYLCVYIYDFYLHINCLCGLFCPILFELDLWTHGTFFIISLLLWLFLFFISYNVLVHLMSYDYKHCENFKYHYVNTNIIS